MSIPEALKREWIDGWLQFRDKAVVGTSLDPELSEQLGKELLGLKAVLKMHGVPFETMEWTFEKKRVCLISQGDSFFLLLVNAHTGLSLAQIAGEFESL